MSSRRARLVAPLAFASLAVIALTVPALAAPRASLGELFIAAG